PPPQSFPTLRSSDLGRNTQADRPFPYVNNNVSMDSANASNIYNAFNLRIEKRASNGLNFLMNYTWSKNLEALGSGSSSFSQNGGDRKSTRLNSSHVK